jgi:hypothetical protein
MMACMASSLKRMYLNVFANASSIEIAYCHAVRLVQLPTVLLLTNKGRI